MAGSTLFFKKDHLLIDMHSEFQIMNFKQCKLQILISRLAALNLYC